MLFQGEGLAGRQRRGVHRTGRDRRRALIVDDVFDTGLSLSEAARLVRDAGAAEVLTAVFAAKPWPTPRAIEPDFVAWEAPTRFLVGYGMDHAGQYRGLPYVGALD